MQQESDYFLCVHSGPIGSLITLKIRPPAIVFVDSHGRMHANSEPLIGSTINRKRLNCSKILNAFEHTWPLSCLAIPIRLLIILI